MADEIKPDVTQPVSPALKEGLGTEMKAQPFVMPKPSTSLGGIRGQQAAMLQDLGQREMDIADIQGKIEQQKATGLRGVAEQERAGAQKLEQGIADFEREFPAPEFHPTKENIPELATLFSLIGVIGTAMGGAGKFSAIASMNAMGGMMKGWQQGRSDLYKKELAEFDKNMLTWKNKLDQTYKKAERGYKMLAYDRQAGEAIINEQIAELGSPLLKAAAQKQGVARAMEMWNGLAQDANQAITRAGTADREKRRYEHEEEMKRIEAGKVKAADIETVTLKDGRLATFNKVTRELTPIEGTEGARKTGTKEDKTAPGVGPTAGLVSFIGTSSGDKKIDQKILDTGKALSATDDLLEKLKDPDIKTGVKLSLEQIKNQILSIKDVNHEITDEEMDRYINGAVSPTEKNAIAKKDALFLAYEIEKEAQGGRLTVQMMRQGGQALDPTKVDKPAYIGIIGTRRKELVKNLNSWKLTPEMQTQLVKGISGERKSRFGSEQTTGSAPAAAIAELKANPTPEMKNFFKQQFGYLPEGL